jgi:predicted phosphoribosyltransferase
MLRLFENRSDAGRQLAERLQSYAGMPGALVLGLPRGGVPVAYEVATSLGLPLDVFTARKLGVPGHAELAMGAVATGDICVLNPGVVTAFNVPDDVVKRIIADTEREVRARELAYRGNRPPVDVKGSTVILVDDGIATGATMRAAVKALWAKRAHRVVVAVPVAAFDALTDVERLADQTIALEMPARFYAVGAWYRDFAEVPDEAVRALLERAAGALPEEMKHAAYRREHVA